MPQAIPVAYSLFSQLFKHVTALVAHRPHGHRPQARFAPLTLPEAKVALFLPTVVSEHPYCRLLPFPRPRKGCRGQCQPPTHVPPFPQTSNSRLVSRGTRVRRAEEPALGRGSLCCPVPPPALPRHLRKEGPADTPCQPGSPDRRPQGGRPEPQTRPSLGSPPEFPDLQRA